MVQYLHFRILKFPLKKGVIVCCLLLDKLRMFVEVVPAWGAPNLLLIFHDISPILLANLPWFLRNQLTTVPNHDCIPCGRSLQKVMGTACAAKFGLAVDDLWADDHRKFSNWIMNDNYLLCWLVVAGSYWANWLLYFWELWYAGPM